MVTPIIFHIYIYGHHRSLIFHVHKKSSKLHGLFSPDVKREKDYVNMMLVKHNFICAVEPTHLFLGGLNFIWPWFIV